MNTWLRRVRGALGMGLVWAIGGFGIGALFELIDNVAPGAFPFIARVDMWPQTLMIPGFIGGVIFGTVLGIVGARRRFDELSMSRFAAVGAVAGALLGGIGMSIGAPVLFVGITTLLGAAGAASTFALARRAEERALVAGDADVDKVGLTRDEARELLGRGE